MGLYGEWMDRRDFGMVNLGFYCGVECLPHRHVVSGQWVDMPIRRNVRSTKFRQETSIVNRLSRVTAFI
jgi:hypothetical protein